MTDKALFAATVRDELPRFERVFMAMAPLTKEQLAYRPHPQSPSAAEILFRTFGSEALMFPAIIATGTVDFAKLQVPDYASAAEVFAALKRSLEEAAAMAETVDQAQWDSEAVMGDWKAPRGIMVWGLLLDLIHHRGQLSTYLRPLGLKVPSIYGPSGDSKD
jgi:uncharacterized damage-inducible protein DinB